MIAILGPGGVGGLLAALLARVDEPVTLVARESTAAELGGRGLHVRSAQFGDFRACAVSVATGVFDPSALVVATKADTLSAALERVAGTPAVVVPLLNGIEHMALLRARFGEERVVAASIRVQATRTAPGEIEHTSTFVRVEVADDGAREVRDALERAGVSCFSGRPEAVVLWSKLVRLCALAVTTTAYDSPLGGILATPELRDELLACVREAAWVSTASGAPADPAKTMREIEELGPNASSSLRRDVQAGRAGELDAIAGAVVRAGEAVGIPCPTIDRLAREIARRV
ncbi:MAG TPA: 2-dehydropantoate 2-reductase [Solirubrobacteraceae bacterium]|nr:2-dehydropantoate 2-reductase [Solirubrobacteraceae bacterium]